MKTLPTRTLARTAALALAAMLIPGAAAADGNSYVVLKGGVYVPTASNVVGSINFSSFPPSGDIELGVGTSLGILGLQLDAGYLWTSKNQDAGSVQVSGVPITGVLQLRFPIAIVVPYVEAGVGLFINTAKLTAVSSSFSNTKVAFMAPLGGGIDVLLGPILVGAEARYLYISPQSYTFGTFPVSTLHMDGVVVTGNLGYRF